MKTRIARAVALVTSLGACGDPSGPPGEDTTSSVGVGGDGTGVGGAGVGATGSGAGTGAGGAELGLRVGYDGVQAFDAEIAGSATAQGVIRSARVFFGHQSIGANTVEGMASLGFGDPWVHWAFPEDADYNGGAYFGQQMIGENRHPAGKVDAFRSFMIDDAYGGRVDMAGFKLCFQDFEADGDGDAVSNAPELALLQARYAATIDDVRAAYPDVVLFHVTPPLVAAAEWSADQNATRVALGDWQKQTYGATDVIFDLQDVESTDPSTQQRCTALGAWALCDANAADDHSHLSTGGKERVAKALMTMVYRIATE
jgi:hypothetical protein